MDAAGAKIYTDTNALRYFGTAFRASPLDDDLRDHLLMSPISIMELLSQLASAGGTDALSAIQAIVDLYHPGHAGLLPWPEDAFREAVFGAPPRPDTLTDEVTKAVNACLAAKTTQELRDESSPLRDLLNQAKRETTTDFADLLKAWKSDGPLPESTHRRIFAHSIAKRADVALEKVDVDRVIDCLNALYIYETDRLKTAAAADNYNVNKHANDILDADQLAYLAYPELNFLRATEVSTELQRQHNSEEFMSFPGKVLPITRKLQPAFEASLPPHNRVSRRVRRALLLHIRLFAIYLSGIVADLDICYFRIAPE